MFRPLASSYSGLGKALVSRKVILKISSCGGVSVLTILACWKTLEAPRCCHSQYCPRVYGFL